MKNETKKIVVFEPIQYSNNNIQCRFCNEKNDCRKTDLQKCLHHHTKKIDLFKLNSKGYKWIILLREHYKYNGDGEFLSAEHYEQIKTAQPFWFNNIERPVHTVLFTNDNVPDIIAQRAKIHDKIRLLDSELRKYPRPIKLFDGRKTRRTAPELYADYDKQVKDYNNAYSRIIDKKTKLFAELAKYPNYDDLYYINWHNEIKN